MGCGTRGGNALECIILDFNHCADDGRAERTLADIFKFVQNIRNQYKNIEFKIVMGTDTNCTLLPNIEGVTGQAVCTLAKSHTDRMRNVVMSLATTLEVRALNTFITPGV